MFDLNSQLNPQLPSKQRDDLDHDITNQELYTQSKNFWATALRFCQNKAIIPSCGLVKSCNLRLTLVPVRKQLFTAG